MCIKHTKHTGCSWKIVLFNNSQQAHEGEPIMLPRDLSVQSFLYVHPSICKSVSVCQTVGSVNLLTKMAPKKKLWLPWKPHLLLPLFFSLQNLITMLSEKITPKQGGFLPTQEYLYNNLCRSPVWHSMGFSARNFSLLHRLPEPQAWIKPAPLIKISATKLWKA